MGAEMRLQPPPRVPATRGPEHGRRAGRGRRPRRPGRVVAGAALGVALLLGLICVFVLLPRWQDRPRDRPTTRVEEPAPTPPAGPLAAPLSPTDTVSAKPDPLAIAESSNPPRATAPPAAATPKDQPTAEDRHFIRAMSEGLAALEDRRWEAAKEAFERAAQLRPGAPEVTDGLARAAAGRRLESIAEGIERAQELERSEKWRDAENAYAAVLAIDPEAAVALEGWKRASDRTDLDERIEYHIENPDRLATSSVFDDAGSALERARDITPKGPRLEAQISRLEAALVRASTPVAVVLVSDGLTDVVIYRVGRLGAFTRRELLLNPGTYTVVGSREGFRDVRLTLVVTPREPSAPLDVRCSEGL